MELPPISKSPNIVTSSITTPYAAIVDNSPKHSSADNTIFNPNFMKKNPRLFVKNLIAIVFVESLKQTHPEIS